MSKDPATLFYIDKWLIATKEMRADCRGWFLNLILHQYDKKDLPAGLEELANLADVRISEYERFKEVFEHVLKQKFKMNARGRLENEFATEILRGRENFKSKRESAGKMSFFVRHIREHLSTDENLIFFIKKNVDLSDVDTKDKHLIEHMFKQLNELYINENKNKNIDENIDEINGGMGETKSPPHSTTIGKLHIIPELLRVFKALKEKYIVQRDKDFPALLKIAQVIAEKEEVSLYSETGIQRIAEVWKSLAQFILQHKHYSNFALFQIEKYIQAITSEFASTQGEYTAQTRKTHTALENNLDASNAAKEMIMHRYNKQQNETN